jgi:deferrochelatase/peroxidase EfeB
MNLRGQLSVIWTLGGEQRNGASHGGALSAGVARALIGFHDGLSNLDPSHPADQALIFTSQPDAPPWPPTPVAGAQPQPGPDQPGYNPAGSAQPSFPPTLRQPPPAEPAWAAGGTYLAIRATFLTTNAWDQLPLQVQEQQVGRHKYSGATLDNPNELAHQGDEPAFGSAPANDQVPPDSHIRRANPRSQSSDANRRLFRRGYPLIVPSTSGTLQRGLLFLAFARSLSTQVDFIMKAWLKNPNFPLPGSGVDPLLQHELQASPGVSSVLAGGYYFVPPLVSAGQPWNWSLPV